MPARPGDLAEQQTGGRRRDDPHRQEPVEGGQPGQHGRTRIGAGPGGLHGQVAHEQPHEVGRPDVVSSQHDDFAEASQQDCAVAVSKH